MNYDDWKLATPPDEDEPKEKEQCSRCLEYFEENDLFYINPNPTQYSKKVCSFCLNNLHSPI